MRGKIETTCAQCGKLFKDFPSNYRKFCCHKCYTLSKRGTKHNKETIEKMRGHIPWNKGKQNIYSPEVLQKMRTARLGIPPPNKGIPMTDKQKKKVSQATKGIKKPSLSKLMQERTGKLANRWKGGLTPLNKIIRNRKRYEDWRGAIFERDNYTCQHCGVRSKKGNGVYLHAHHIKCFAEYPNLRFEISNGLTLCEECHGKAHGRIIVRKRNDQLAIDMKGL